MKTALLVDDSKAVRMVGTNIVGSLGFQVLEAGDGKSALEVLQNHPEIDVILLDWNMPIMSGLKLLKTIREDSTLPQPKVVMCTTENEMRQIVKAMDAGADEYIMKPFTEEIIAEKFEEIGLV